MMAAPLWLRIGIAAALLSVVLAGGTSAGAEDSGDTPVRLPEITVTAPAEQGYSVPSATAATKSDTPIMETPVSVQVVPQQVLQDQQVTRIEQAVTNVSGVYTSSIFQGGSADDFVIRGFRTNQILYRDGFRLDTGIFGKRDTANIQQIEVVKGPASVLYGRIEPGGLINYVTKKPLAAPYYAVEQQFGSFDFYRTTLDATGPITQDGTLLYRLNVAYENSGSFREFVGDEHWLVAPVVEWRPTPRTDVRLELDYFQNDTTPDNIGLIALGNRPAPIPIERNLGEPTDFQNSTDSIVALTASQQLTDHWTLAGRFNTVIGNEEDGGVFGDVFSDADLIDGRLLPRVGQIGGLGETIHQFTYAGALDLTGKFTTWRLAHTLLVGGDYYHKEVDSVCCDLSGFAPAPIDIFAPVHGVTLGPVDSRSASRTFDRLEWYGLYLQDQIELPYHLFLLAGLRYDSAESASNSFFGSGNSSDDAVTPRAGLLWRPVPWLSLYGSYTENFGAQNGSLIDRSGQPLPPETAQQWEVGAKTEVLGGRLTGTVAYFDLTKQNIATADPAFPPDDPVHALAIGEATSNGVEVDVAGEVLPGWNVIAGYAYTRTEILNDSFLGTAGNQLPNVPRNGGRVWTTYSPGSGALQGLTVGAGVTARGQRQGDLANDFQLPGYATVDLMAAYAVAIGPTRVRVQLNVDNLLDETFFESSADFTRSRIAPGAPRAFLGRIAVEF